MLALPQKINRSVKEHNHDYGVFCDWVEASVLFDEDALSQSDVVKVLIDQQIYNDGAQDFCKEYVSSVWRELRVRLGLLGNGSPVKFESQRIIRVLEWWEVPAHSFCLLLGLKPFFDGWIDKFGQDHTEQGILFEELTREAVSKLFNGWECDRTGWGADQAVKLTEVVPKLAARFSEDVGDIEKWASKHAKEQGVDVVWYKDFRDRRGGYPVYLAQCASGADWTEKLHTPEMPIWEKIILWKHPPRKAFALPFALQNNEFTRRCNQAEALFLDRYRILSPANDDSSWVSTDLSTRLNVWLVRRVLWMLKLNG